MRSRSLQLSASSRYFERLLGLEIHGNAVEPSRRPLILLNRTEVEDARTRTLVDVRLVAHGPINSRRPAEDIGNG